MWLWVSTPAPISCGRKDSGDIWTRHHLWVGISSVFFLIKDARRTWPTKPTKQCSNVLAETKATIIRSASVCTGSSTYVLGSPNSGVGCFSFVLFVLSPIWFLVESWHEGFFFNLLYVFFCLFWFLSDLVGVSWQPALFWRETGKVDLE